MSTVPEKLRLRVKGPVNARKEVYIPRPSDDEVFELLREGEYCNVVASRQMGKTSLLFRTKLRLAEVGVKTCSIDVGGIPGTPENADAWYQGLLKEIVDQRIGLNLDVAAWWKASPSATPNQRLIQFFRDEVAVQAGAPVVIFLDEIEYTLKFSYTDDFFLAIRAMYNDRQREPAFERITFCLLGVVTPNELIKYDRTTPYNIGRTIELRDFDHERDDLGALYSAVNEDPELGKLLVGAVFGWTGGHPYLTMKHCAEVARSGAGTPQELDQLIERSYTSLEAAKSDEHFDAILRFVRGRLGDHERVTALTLYRRVSRGQRELDETTPAHIALKLSGLVKRDEHGQLAVRNRIYRKVFTDDWAAKMQQQQRETGVVVDDSATLPSYSNFCRLTATPEEVILDFGLNPQPIATGRQEVKANHRIAMNFYTAKRIWRALDMMIQLHEGTFGSIEVDVRRRAVGTTQRSPQPSRVGPERIIE
jgi:hypothetical protein